MSSAKDDVMEELKKIKAEQEKSAGNSVIARTVAELLSIEKRSLYGTVRGKSKMMDQVILKEISNYRDSKNAS